MFQSNLGWYMVAFTYIFALLYSISYVKFKMANIESINYASAEQVDDLEEEKVENF